MMRTSLLALLAACSSGETTSEEWYTAPAVDAGIDAAPACPMHFCNDSAVTCQHCLCPGEPCQHVAYPSGDVIAAGTCSPDLVCSAHCPSIDCVQENP